MPRTPTFIQKRAALRHALDNSPFIVAPAVHDVFSLRLVEKAGYGSACISGAMLSYGLLGIPDIGLLSLTECVEHCRRLVRASSIPITADADAGYGNARGTHYAVELFEEAGAAGVNIEDQVVPRRFGAAARKEVVGVREMAGKITAASRARQDPNFLVIARTDACAVESIEQVIDRARAYQDAGADLVLPMAPRSEADIERLVRALDIPVTISAGTGLAPTPSAAGVSLARLRDLGVRRVSLTTLLPGGAIDGMNIALAAVQRAAAETSPHDAAASLPAGRVDFNVLFDTALQHAFEDELLN
jgi:2-methylisocitrate lyase-like PEP mutase family enzyme